MISKLFKFVNIQYLVLALLIIVISSCDGTDISNNDKEQNSNNGSIEIGVDGGTITVNDLTITIPKGAFTQTANIKVTQSGSDNTGEEAVTQIYSIEGLPNNYSLPIDVKIKLNGTTNNETYLIVQDEVFIPSLNSVNKSNVYFDAAISGDLLIGQIPALQSDFAEPSLENTRTVKKSSSGVLSLYIFGSTNKRTYTTGDNNFKIIYDVSKDDITDIVNLGQYLEVAYTKIEDMGFDLHKRDWPASVFIDKLKNEHGLFTASHWSINGGHIIFDRAGLHDEGLVKTSAMHELFHLAQYLYDPRGTFKQGSYPPEHYWFNEACSVWSEELVAPADYISNNWIQNKLRPFSGLQAGALDDPEQHGYGMSAFVKYLTGKYGKNILISIYKKIQSGRHVIDAINNSTNYNLFLDSSLFFKGYSQGIVYSYFGLGDVYLTIKDKKFIINNENDTFNSFSALANYNDLSAKAYQVELTKANFQEGDVLELNIDKDLCDITVFKYPWRGTDNIVAEGDKNCTVNDLKSLSEQHKQLIVLVTNSNFISNNYTPSNLDINLQMQVKSQKKIGVEVNIDIDGATYREKVNNENWVSKPNEKFIDAPSSGINGPKLGSIVNNVFSAPLDNVYNPLHVESSYSKITFLENPKRINLEYELIIDDKTTGIQKHRKVLINNIPEEDTDRYWEYGSSLSRAIITDTYYRKDYTGEFTSELVSVSPSNNAKVEVRIR